MSTIIIIRIFRIINKLSEYFLVSLFVSTKCPSIVTTFMNTKNIRPGISVLLFCVHKYTHKYFIIIYDIISMYYLVIVDVLLCIIVQNVLFYCVLKCVLICGHKILDKFAFLLYTIYIIKQVK